MDAEEKRQRKDDLRRLITETGSRFVGLYVLAFVMLGVVSATTAATAWLMKDVINEVFIAKSQQALFFVAGAVFVIYVARGAAPTGRASSSRGSATRSSPMGRSGSFPRCSRRR